MSEMSTPSAATPPAMPSPLRLITTLGLIAMLSGFTIVLIYQMTLEPIARNHREALERAVFELLPGAVSRANFAVIDQELIRLSDEELASADLFAGFDEDGNLIGVALEAASRGYAGEIRVLFGYAPDREKIIGFTVLQSSETPGLGDKIETDPRFLANFEALDVRLDETGEALANPIQPVPEGAKTRPWEIDGITGATVSAVAVARALRESTETWVPLVFAHQDELAEESE